MSTKLYDITNLIADFQNDKEAIYEMIRIFIEFTPSNLTELNNAFNNSDYQALASTAHKMKYSISNYGIESIKDDIIAIEQLSKQKVSLNLIKSYIDNVNYVLNRVLESIKQEIP